MTDCNPVDTPQELKFDYDAIRLPEKTSFFRSVLGSLIYLATATRPDIAHAVSLASRVGTPTLAHLALLKRIVRYLNGTKSLGIRFQKGHDQLEVFVDADFANDLNTRRSTTGYLFWLNGPIGWRSIRQPIVALSSTEAEYLAGCEAVKDLLPVRNLLVEVEEISPDPTTVHIDNQSAVKMSANLVSRQRTKHIDVRSRWLSQQVADKQVVVEHIPGNEQLANVLTKPLARPRFTQLRTKVMNLVLLLMSLLAVSHATGCQFSKVEPVYYKPTKMVYVDRTTSHSTTVVVANPCRVYFRGLLPNLVLNEQLIISCESWYRKSTADVMRYCSTRDVVPVMKQENKVAVKRDLRDVDYMESSERPLMRTKRLVGEIYTMVVLTPAVTYAIVQGEKNDRNLKKMAEAYNNMTSVLGQAVKSLN